MTDKRECSNCHFRRGSECHRDAPRCFEVTASEVSQRWAAWPLVQGDWWCGDWEPLEDPE